MKKSSPIVCPFCPLHCDDVVVDDSGNVNVDCSIATRQFRGAFDPEPVTRVAPNPIDQKRGDDRKIRVSVASAALLLSRTLADLICNEQIELSIDETPTDSAMRTAISRDGTIAATLGDIRKHADTILVIGDPLPEMPRLWQRLGVGDHASPGPIRFPSEGKLDADRLADLSYRIRASDSKDDSLVKTIEASKYLAIIVAPQAFESGEELAVAELLVKLVLDLNRADNDSSRRAVLISIDPFATLRSVVAWQTNTPLTTTSGAVDVRIGNAPAGSHPARVQWGGVDPGESMAESFFPAPVAGVHHADAVIRGDGTVTLPLSLLPKAAPRESTLSRILPAHQGRAPSKAGAEAT